MCFRGKTNYRLSVGKILYVRIYEESACTVQFPMASPSTGRKTGATSCGKTLYTYIIYSSVHTSPDILKHIHEPPNT